MKKRIAIMLSLAIALCTLAVPATAFAQGDTTTVTGDVPQVIEVLAPDGFAMPSLDPSATQPITSNPKTVFVNVNGANWDLKVSATNGGHMASTSTPADMLAAAMMANDVTLTDAAQNLVAGQNPGEGKTVSCTLKQTVGWDDPVHDDYSITVTFAASLTV